MTHIFKNSFLSVLGILLIFGFAYRIYLSTAPIVPAWVPPPVCPCWDNLTFACHPTSFCKGEISLIPTPTPYLEAIPTAVDDIKIASLDFTSECSIVVSFSNNSVSTYPLPTDRTINTSDCPQKPKRFFSPDGTMAIFENFANPQSAALSLYDLTLNKVVSLENIGSDPILDVLILPDKHLFVLFKTRLKIYDLATLIRNYPANIDFYLNKFKSLSLESTEKRLDVTQIPYAFIRLDGNKISILGSDNTLLTTFDLTSLYPRSSCPCWETQTNVCLPQSECLNR